MEKKDSSPVKEMKADLVIIGTGGGGMAAAVAAAENGIKDIIVLEKLKSIGGNTAMSAGLFGTRVQQGSLLSTGHGMVALADQPQDRTRLDREIRRNHWLAGEKGA